MEIYCWLWTAAFLIFGAEQAPAQVDGLQPWSSNTDPTDEARSHIEEITDGQHEYVVTQDGTMDGQNCRSPVGVYES